MKFRSSLKERDLNVSSCVSLDLEKKVVKDGTHPARYQLSPQDGARSTTKVSFHLGIMGRANLMMYTLQGEATY